MRVQLGKILTQACEGKYIDHPEREKYITVLLYGRGVKERTINEGKIPVQFNAWVAHTGQLIYSRINAENGAYAIVPHYLDGAVVSKDFPLYWIDTSQVLPDYLFYSLTSDAFVKKAQKNSVGATMRRLKEPVFESMEINLPTIEEQERIVSQIKRTISVIQGYQSHLTKLDQLIKARFVEMFGEDTTFLKRAQHCVADVCESRVGIVIQPTQYYTDDKASGIKAFRSMNIKPFYVNDEEWVYFSPEDNAKLSRTQVRKGDVAVVRSGANLGDSCAIPQQYVGCNAVDILLLSCNELALPIYLSSFINYPVGKNQILNLQRGGAIKHLNLKQLEKSAIYIPPMDEQTKYATFVSQIDKSKVVVQEALDEAKLLFDSLIQKYFG